MPLAEALPGAGAVGVRLTAPDGAEDTIGFRTDQEAPRVTCGGIEIHVVDREEFLPFLTGIQLICCAAGSWPEAFDWRREPYEFECERLAIDLLAGGPWLRELVEEGMDPAGAPEKWEIQLREFRILRNKYLLY